MPASTCSGIAIQDVCASAVAAAVRVLCSAWRDGQMAGRIGMHVCRVVVKHLQTSSCRNLPDVHQEQAFPNASHMHSPHAQMLCRSRHGWSSARVIHKGRNWALTGCCWRCRGSCLAPLVCCSGHLMVQESTPNLKGCIIAMEMQCWPEFP